MLVIRLSRTGRKGYPTYRIVAADSRRAATGKLVMVLGHYNPHTKELVLKKEATEQYIKNGAQPSNSVIKLLQQEQVDLPDWVQLKTKTRAPKKEKTAAAPAEASDQPTDAPADEPAAADSVAQVASEHADQVAEAEQPNDKVETADTVQAEVAAAEKVEDAGAAAADQASELPE